MVPFSVWVLCTCLFSHYKMCQIIRVVACPHIKFFDRDNYVQWLRFLWESYRTCLEVLKNNVKLEELYAVCFSSSF